MGYAACGEELLAQTFEQGLALDRVICASGSGGTHAGLLTALEGNHANIALTGISVRHPKERQEASILALAEACADLVGANDHGGRSTCAARAIRDTRPL